jgi:hypothetical protein
MPADIDFSNRNDVRRWLLNKPREVAVVFAARAALRVAPLLAGALRPRRGGIDQNIILLAFRAMAAPWVAGHYPIHGLEVRAASAHAASAAANIAATYAVYADANAVHAVNAAVHAAHASANAVVAAARDSANAAHASAYAACYDASYVDASSADALDVDEEANASVLAERPLWLTEVPTWARDGWQRLEEALLKQNQDWRVWIDWYQARLEGRPANETLEVTRALIGDGALEVARVLIADEIWEQGPRAVNAEITWLIEQHEKHEIFEHTSQDWDFFLSFNRDDEQFARWIEKLLKAVGISVFAAFAEMPPGSNFVIEMQRGLARSSRFLALLSPAYFKSDHCQAEWSAAFNADPVGTARKLVPILIRATELPPLAVQIVHTSLIGLSSADAARTILQAIGYEGTLGEIPPGWPGNVAIEQMQAAAGGVYEVAPDAGLLLKRQPPKVGEAADGGFTPDQLFADFAREIEELAEHLNQGTGNFYCSVRLKQRVARLYQSVTANFVDCDVLAINKRLVWVLRAVADDKADGVIPPNDMLEHYASDLYGYYKRLEFIFPRLKQFREMDARQRFTMPTEEEERAIGEVYRSFGDQSVTRGALSSRLSEEMKQVGESIEEAREVATKNGAGEPPDIAIESHVDAATRSLAIWGWLSNPREKIARSGRRAEQAEKAIRDYEKLYDRTSPQMIKYIGYLLKWFF